MRRNENLLTIGEHSCDLDTFDRVFLVGAGKAGAPMARAAAAVLGDRLTAGLVIIKEGHREAEAASPVCEIVEAGHPLPDQRGVQATQRIAALLDRVGERDLVITLISGGGSALLTLPVPGVSLADLQQLTSALLACGATIHELNTLRKHLDQLKGGGMARRAVPATLVTLILSDVVGNPLDIIASGPTVPDSSTFSDAWALLERYALLDTIPESIRAHLQLGIAGRIAETPRADDRCFDRVSNLLVGSNQQAAEAAMRMAQQAGFNTMLLTTQLQGEAREVGRVVAAIGRQLATSNTPLSRPACIIAGGETTVTLRGAGKGGRNQELALAAVAGLAGLPNITLITLATDGGDGPTDAAGAVVTGATWQRAQARGLDPADYLARNDAYHFFAALGDLVKTGPTRTNVNDLLFLFAGDGSSS